ncbi:hypothetical protein HHI36_001463 [Cryptolaemus montrouzieri]|uniref:Uncharacterized protein n=1 Tax=Cryptolaemus montrouzieri TaxID=559131 RepID=A0ABD2P8F9_9CUCU
MELNLIFFMIYYYLDPCIANNRQDIMIVLPPCQPCEQDPPCQQPIIIATPPSPPPPPCKPPIIVTPGCPPEYPDCRPEPQLPCPPNPPGNPCPPCAPCPSLNHLKIYDT